MSLQRLTRQKTLTQLEILSEMKLILQTRYAKERITYLSNLLDIYNIFCIFSIGANYLCTPSHLLQRFRYSFKVSDKQRLNQLSFPKEATPEEVAPPASSVYLKLDPTDLVQPTQCQIP